MSSIDDIFMVSDSEEEEEESIKPPPKKIATPAPQTQQSKKKSEEKSKIIKTPKEKKNDSIQEKRNDTVRKEKNDKYDRNQSSKKKDDKYNRNQASKERDDKYSRNKSSKESIETKNKITPKQNYVKKCNDILNFEFNEINPQADYSEKIDQLRKALDDHNRQFETDFEDLKSKNAEKLAILKQNNLSQEQSLSNSYNLEYRNLIWTTTLRHLKRGCFSENLGLLFQQAINDEQFQLEKELIEIKQKNEEEIDNYRSKMPIERERRKVKKRKINVNYMSPKEMASMIYNQFHCKIENEDLDYNIIKKIDNLISKVQKESNKLSSNNFNPTFNPFSYDFEPIFTPVIKKSPKKSKSPVLIQNEKNLQDLKHHITACNKLQKTVKKTDKYIKKMQENEWFQEMFPHVE